MATSLLHGTESFLGKETVSASQVFPQILWNSTVHYRIHKCPSPVPTLNQLDTVHKPTSHFLNIHLNIILPSTIGSPNRSYTLRFPHQALYTPLLSPYALHATSISFFTILSPETYWVSSTDHEVPHYAVFSTHLLPPTSYIKYFPQQPFLK